MTVKIFPVCSTNSQSTLKEDSADDTTSTVSVTQQRAAREEDEEVKVQHQFCWGLCCFQGCVIGSAAAIYFMCIIPAGFILVLLGSNIRSGLALAVGISILCTPIIIIPTACLLWKWKRHKKERKRDQKYKARPQSYVNKAMQIDIS